MSVLSMDFSASCVRFAEGSFDDNKLSITNCACVELPPTVYNGQNLGDIGIFSEIIRNAIRDNGFTSKTASITIGSSAVVYKAMEAPKIKVPKVLAKVIATEMKKNIINSQENMVADYIQLREKEDNLDVFGIMMPRYLVESYQNLILRCGLQPVSMQVYTSSLFNLVTELYNFSDLTGYIFANVMKNKEMHLIMFEKYEDIFARTVKIETNSMEIKSSMSEEDSESAISSIVDHISKMIQFQSSRNRHAPIRKVFMVGELSGNAQFVSRIAEGLIDVETTGFSPSGGVSMSAAGSFSEYAVCIGALVY